MIDMARLRSVGRYTVEDQTIGKGNFAVVELATHTITKTKVALKVIEKRKITKPYVKKNLTREARIMSTLRHPNIVRLYETITSPQLYCLVMEYVPGGDLLTLVRGQKGGRLKEGVARRFVRQLVSALHHMHEHGIVHRDLKMENIMMDKKRENIKIIDFGLSNQCALNELFKTHCGSPEYAAPELFVAGRDYGPEVDIWSLGINMFAMVTGKLPFSTPHSENRRQHLLGQIRKGLKGVHDKEMAHLTDDCKDLLHGCIEPVAEDRLPLLDIEQHAWITSEDQEPFCPYQAPPQDLDLRAEVIEEMAARLKVNPEKIQDVVQENKLDDVSAIFNILLEEYQTKRGLFAGDHTRPSTPQTPTGSARSRSGRRGGSQASGTRPGSSYTDSLDGVRTPTVVSMVRPSLKSPERKNTKTVDFELDVVESEPVAWAERIGLKTGLPPPWAKKNRPLGNATTVNRVMARTSYRNRTPGTDLSTSDQDYAYAHTDLLHSSTIHILVPTPSFESQQTSQTEMDSANPNTDEPRATSPEINGGKRRRAERAGGGRHKGAKPITNVRVSFLGSVADQKNGAKKEQKRALKAKQIPIPDDRDEEESHEGNVVDLPNSLSGRHHNYHGYHVEETPITKDDETAVTKLAEPVKDKKKEVRLCVAHREFLQDGQKPSGGRRAATPYSAPRSRTTENEIQLTTTHYPLESGDIVSQSNDTTTPTLAPQARTKSTLKKRERAAVDTVSTASSNSVLSPRSLLHPSIASIHGKKETAAILSNFAVLRCSDTGDTLTKIPRNHTSSKRSDREKTKGEKERKDLVTKSPEPPVCRRTTVELNNRAVRGRKFTMFNEMPQRAPHKRPLRRSQNSSSHNASIQFHDSHSTRLNARLLQTDGAPSKFIQKFGGNRMTQTSKDGHRHCRVPTFGYSKDNFAVTHPSSPNHLRSAATASRATSPLRRVVDISEQAMSSLVNEAIRDKKNQKKEDSCGDIVKSVQRHFSRTAQRRSQACEMYTRFVPIKICRDTGREKGMIRPSSSPAPRLNAPTETVFNILETLPSPPFPTPPPPSSASAPPPIDKKKSCPLATGRKGATTATGITGSSATSASEVNRGTPLEVESLQEWDASYRLERKISDTVKGATFVRNMRNEQRTRAWVADMASEYTPTMVAD